jgi:protein-tyrosine-phosphatase
MSEKMLLFVCTGNICRSPMAEYMFRDHIRGTHPDWQILSAGTFAGRGNPASRFAVKALKEIAIDMRAHRSQPLTDELVQRADMIVTMTEGHVAELLERYPYAKDKTFMLKSFDPASDGGDVMDPIGLSLDVYRYIRGEISNALWGLGERIGTLNNE